MRRVLLFAVSSSLIAVFTAGLLISPGCDDLTAVDTAAFRDVEDDKLRKMLDDVLDVTERRYMSTRDHAAWQILHGVLTYHKGLKIYHEGELQNAVEYIQNGGRITGFNWYPTPHGLDSIVEPGSKTGQGHDDQWMAVLAQAGVRWDDTIVYQGKPYTMADMVRQAQQDVSEDKEMSWTIIALTAFPEHVKLDDTWRNGDPKDEREWSIERVLASEARQELNSSACGGTHRLIGMQMAMLRYFQENGDQEPTDGWKAARERVNEAVRLLKAHQNDDGSFSTEYLKRRTSTSDAEEGMNRTGHTLEFLTFALTDEELREPWVERAVVHLCELFRLTRDEAVECGSLYHAAHALQRYRARRWGVQQFSKDERVDNAVPQSTEPIDASRRSATSNEPPVPPKSS